MIAILVIVAKVAGAWLSCGLGALVLCWVNEGLISDDYLASTDQSIKLARLQWPKRTILLWGLVSLLVFGWILLVNGQTLNGGQALNDL